MYLGLQTLWPYAPKKPDVFRFRVFFRECSLQNEVGDPPFIFCIFGKSRSLPFCVANLKKICTWDLFGGERNKGDFARGQNNSDILHRD